MSSGEFLKSLGSRPQGREQKELCESLQDLHSRRLWHQLTDKLEIVVDDAAFFPILIEMYDKCIHEFALKLNPLRLVQICVKISRQYVDPAEAIAFLGRVESRINEKKSSDRAGEEKQPLLYLRMNMAQLHLKAGDIVKCRDMVNEGKEELERLTDVHPVVSAAVHWALAQYCKAKQDFAGFYRAAIQYLAFVSSEELPADFRLELAVDIGLSALLGDDVYSFGELLLHPLVSSLDNSPYAWLRELLDCFNRGDLHGYDELCVKHARMLNAQPQLVQNERRLREKITVMSLMEMVFHTPAHQRSMPLTDIAARTKLSVEGVEELLMRCLSLRLMEGRIDQVAGVVHVSWVQPRVLTLPQVAALRDRLVEWVDKVKAMSLSLEQEAVGVAEV